MEAPFRPKHFTYDLLRMCFGVKGAPNSTLLLVFCQQSSVICIYNSWDCVQLVGKFIPSSNHISLKCIWSWSCFADVIFPLWLFSWFLMCFKDFGRLVLYLLFLHPSLDHACQSRPRPDPITRLTNISVGPAVKIQTVQSQHPHVLAPDLIRS